MNKFVFLCLFLMGSVSCIAATYAEIEAVLQEKIAWNNKRAMHYLSSAQQNDKSSSPTTLQTTYCKIYFDVADRFFRLEEKYTADLIRLQAIKEVQKTH